MARIRQDDVEAVRERTDIVRLVSEYVALKKAGKSMTAVCPFHTEKTPSFTVDAGKQVYYCFGCGVGGNAFHFLMGVEHLTFPEAVERLARRAGITLRYEGLTADDRKQMSRRQALYRANAHAAELYHRFLLESKEAEAARRYLQARGFSRATVETFGIGFAPGYPDFLLRRTARDVSPELLVEAGLARKDAGGAIRDFFRSRVTFPVHDLAGQSVGFGARLLEGEGPKYLNSSDTPVYRKSEMLYNLNRAKAEITRAGRAFVVEGYTDVIDLHQAGVPIAVATCGTAVGESHFRLLSRFARRVILAFDSDEAGARAAERAHAFFETYGLEVQVLILPAGLDPADFVTENGAEEFEALAGKAEPLVDYMLERSIRDTDLATPEGKARAWRQALPIVERLTDPVLQGEYAGRLADLVGVGDTEIRRALQSLHERGGSAGPPAEEAAVDRRDPVREVEKEALKLLVQHPEMARDQLGSLRPDHFAAEQGRQVFAFLLAAGDETAGVVERAGEHGMTEVVAELAVEPLKGEATPGYAKRVFSRLEELSIDRRIATMKRRLQRLNPTTEPDTYDSMFEELVALEGERRRVRALAEEGDLKWQR